MHGILFLRFSAEGGPASGGQPLSHLVGGDVRIPWMKTLQRDSALNAERHTILTFDLYILHDDNFNPSASLRTWFLAANSFIFRHQ